ncbi:hypothetical protein bthur0005_59300 [Bacillus thuringiensis serovar pakistani str. T13001]|nr:hypothetical protein bthur0005_59300 [Bacillus thuringiensis serovar pakistani str. T13001]
MFGNAIIYFYSLNVFFNHNQIDSLFFKGFETVEELELRNKLAKF